MRSMAMLMAPLLALAMPASAQNGGKVEVDLELVLAVDISYSMDPDEQALQREGYMEALTSKEAIAAIRSGVHGRIAVTYVEWAGANQQSVIAKWQIIDGQQSAETFTAKLAESPPRRAYRTSISSALLFSAGLFEDSGATGARRVIDISGDGVNNQGPLITNVRDELVAKGIIINGLPVMIKPPNTFSLDVPNLDDYYRDCVIGGQGAFILPATSREVFKEAIRNKLILEVADLAPPPRFIRVQSPSKVSCSVGESMWGNRYGRYGDGN